MSRISYYKGEPGDKFCGLCGGSLTKVRCYTGTFDTKTGKKKTELLLVCKNDGCYGKAPEDLMIVGSKYGI